jgi:tetratricopeptide (TPR) repeat protein
MAAREMVSKAAGALVLIVVLAMPLPAQNLPDDPAALRDRAFQLIREGKQIEALPYLEKLSALRPDDKEVLERLGAAVVASTVQVSDPEAKKKLVLRARSIFLQAKRLGDDSDYVHVMLQQLPESGELPTHSRNKQVDQAINEGEAAFAKGDFPAAVKAYERAYQMDPTSYSAALFAGDAYFNMNQIDQAGAWFAKAIQIDPNRETAYRYWGNGLLRQGKSAEARAKYVDAIVAEPYNRTAWSGLVRWGGLMKVKLGHPQIVPRGSVSADGDNTTVNIDPNSLGKEEGGDYWLIYPISRAAWQGERFKKEFPNEKEYRHSLREETEALAAVATLVAKDLEDPAKRDSVPPDLQALARLREQGLLEAFVLLSRPDNGIAQDYAAFREAHRDMLARYVSEWIISSQPAE